MPWRSCPSKQEMFPKVDPEFLFTYQCNESGGPKGLRISVSVAGSGSVMSSGHVKDDCDISPFQQCKGVQHVGI